MLCLLVNLFTEQVSELCVCVVNSGNSLTIGLLRISHNLVIRMMESATNFIV